MESGITTLLIHSEVYTVRGSHNIVADYLSRAHE